jgi:hypothetical protein
VDRASGSPGCPPTDPRSPLQGVSGSIVVASVSYGSGVYGSKRLSKRVYGSFAKGSFKSHRFATGDCKGTDSCIFRGLQSLHRPLPSLHERSCKLNPPRLGHVRTEEFDREVDSHRL